MTDSASSGVRPTPEEVVPVGWMRDIHKAIFGAVDDNATYADVLHRIQWLAAQQTQRNAQFLASQQSSEVRPDGARAIPRHTIEQCPNGSIYFRLVDDPEGAWVTYANHLAALTQRDARLAAILEARDKIVQAEREGSRGGWAWLAQPDDGPLPHGLPEYHAMLAGAYRTIDRLLDQLAALGADEEGRT